MSNTTFFDDADEVDLEVLARGDGFGSDNDESTVRGKFSDKRRKAVKEDKKESQGGKSAPPATTQKGVVPKKGKKNSKNTKKQGGQKNQPRGKHPEIKYPKENAFEEWNLGGRAEQPVQAPAIKIVGADPRKREAAPEKHGAEEGPEHTTGRPAGQPTAGVPKQTAPKFKDLAGWTKAYRHAVSASDEEVLLKAKEDGWLVTPSEKPVPVHGYSHLARDVATLYVLSQLPPDLKRARVLDWFGSERNRRFDPSSSGPYCTIDGKPSKTILQVDWVSGPEKEIAGDRARAARPGREPVDPLDLFDTVLIQDVYQQGNSWETALTPALVKQLCSRCRYGNAYIVCRRFKGWAGADGTAKRPEGVWYRDGDNMIVFSPDTSSPAYPKHPDLDWLDNRSVDGLDVSFLQQFGPFSVFRCAPQSEGAQSLGPQPEDSGKVNWVELETNDWRDWVKSKLGFYRLRESTSKWLPNWVRAKLPKNRFLVHLPTFYSLVDQYSQRVATGITMDSALLAVTRKFDSSYEMSALATRFPSVYQKILRDTELAVVHARRASMSRDLCHLRREGSEGERQLTTARSAATPAGNEKRPLWQWMLAATSILALLTFKARSTAKRMPVLRARAGDVGLLKMVRDCGFGDPTYVWRTRPLVGLNIAAHVAAEETVRSIWPFMGRALWIGEFVLNALQIGVWALPTLAMHSVADHLVEKFGHAGRVASFGLHLVWNCSILGLAYETFDNCLEQLGMDATTHAMISARPASSWDEDTATWTAEQKQVFGLSCAVRSRHHLDVRDNEVQHLRESFQAFLSNHAVAGRVDAKSLAVAIPAGTTIASYTSRTLKGPKHFRGEISITVDGTHCATPEEGLRALDDCTLQAAPNVIHPILITNGLLWEPAKNDKNLLVAILHRTHNDPFVGADTPAVRHARWRNLAARAIRYGLFDLAAFDIPTIEECVEVMGKRGQRIMKAYVADEVLGENENLRKTITEKWNETITAEKDMGDCVSMKPRAIINLDAVYHSKMTQWARACTEVLHQLFDGRVTQIAGVPVRIFFAAGYTQEQLNVIGEAMASGEIVIAAAGDDSCASLGALASDDCGPFVEADQGQFDHTQDEGPTVQAAPQWLAKIGAPKWFVLLLIECCQRAYRLKTRRMTVKGRAGTQMPTGITLTTVMNSIDTILMYVFWIEALVEAQGKPVDLAALGKKLGFVVKLWSKSDLGQVTFLRGWWRRSSEGSLCWMPLPSSVLKLGKILRNPVEITSRRVKGSTVHRTPEEAASVVAYALARCYQGIPATYPILGPFLAALLRCGKWTPKRIEGVVESATYKPKITTGDVDREEAMQAVCTRYGLEQEDVERVEALFATISRLPSYVEDPLFYRLLDVDYA